MYFGILKHSWISIRVRLNSTPREQPQNYEMRPHVYLFRSTDV